MEFIFDILDLFYANKHLYAKLRRRENAAELWRQGKG